MRSSYRNIATPWSRPIPARREASDRPPATVGFLHVGEGKLTWTHFRGVQRTESGNGGGRGRARRLKKRMQIRLGVNWRWLYLPVFKDKANVVLCEGLCSFTKIFGIGFFLPLFMLCFLGVFLTAIGLWHRGSVGLVAVTIMDFRWLRCVDGRRPLVNDSSF